MDGAETTVLIIDGHREVRERLARGLSGASFQVIGHTDNPVLGVEMAHLREPNIILADFHQTGRKQVEMVRWLRQVSPDSRIVVLSSFLDAGEKRQCLEAGAQKCLLKGTSMRDLREALVAVADEIREGSAGPTP